MKPGMVIAVSPRLNESGPLTVQRITMNDASVTADESSPSARLSVPDVKLRRSSAVLKLKPVVDVLVEPGAQVSAGEPGAPAHLQHLRQVQLVDCHDDVDAGEAAEVEQQILE